METAMVTAVVAQSRCDPRADEVEALDARLAELARNAAPLRRALARIAGGFVERRAWEPLGFARLADYARERPGLSARELYDLAHVDAALAKLPAIDAALASGQLGWTKARLLCRVATPEDEGLWLAAAGRLSAAALAREVRAIDVGSLEAGALDPLEDEPGEREVLRVRTQRQVKSKWGYLKRALWRVAGERLPSETCVELVAAEVLSAIRLEVDPAALPPLTRRVHSGMADPELAAEPALRPVVPAQASPFVEALVAGLEDAEPRDLDARLRRAAALEQGLLARIGPLLLAFVSARGPYQLGFRSLDAYARGGSRSRRARREPCCGWSAPAPWRRRSARRGARAASRRPSLRCSSPSCSPPARSPSTRPGSSARRT
jgi:hypothetical protein